MKDACWLHLRNGWTVSIAPPFGGEAGIANIAAWPTVYDFSGNVSDETGWFHFSDGIGNKRCYCLADIRDALTEVERADPPEV